MKDLVNLLSKVPKLIGLKVSLEDEGIKPTFLPFFRELADKAGVELRIKIGGPEARSDARLAQEAKADAIVGPMLESAHGIRKFISIPFDGKKYAMVETKFALKNFKEFIFLEHFLDGFVFGRTDIKNSFLSSMYSDHIEENIDYDSLIQDLLPDIKIDTFIGGGLYMKDNFPLNVTGYETRNVIMKRSSIIDPIPALKFEVELLKTLSKMDSEDKSIYYKRIKKLEYFL